MEKQIHDHGFLLERSKYWGDCDFGGDGVKTSREWYPNGRPKSLSLSIAIVLQRLLVNQLFYLPTTLSYSSDPTMIPTHRFFCFFTRMVHNCFFLVNASFVGRSSSPFRGEPGPAASFCRWHRVFPICQQGDPSCTNFSPSIYFRPVCQRSRYARGGISDLFIA